MPFLTSFQLVRFPSCANLSLIYGSPTFSGTRLIFLFFVQCHQLDIHLLSESIIQHNKSNLELPFPRKPVIRCPFCIRSKLLPLRCNLPFLLPWRCGVWWIPTQPDWLTLIVSLGPMGFYSDRGILIRLPEIPVFLNETLEIRTDYFSKIIYGCTCEKNLSLNKANETKSETWAILLGPNRYSHF